MPRPFLLLLALPSRATNHGGALGRLRKLLPEQGTEVLLAWENGVAIGFEAEAAPEEHRIRESVGERAQFVVVELGVSGQWATEGFGVAAGWLKRHCGMSPASGR